jgi:hypothetical protein
MKIENMGKIAIVALLSVALLCTPAAAVTTIWSGTVNLGSGTSQFSPSNNESASYTIPLLTDLGALVAGSNGGNNYEYFISDSWYPYYGCFYLESIDDIAADDTNLTAWFININGSYAEYGLGSNTINEGDTVEFYYASYDNANWTGEYENATYNVIIHVI